MFFKGSTLDDALYEVLRSLLDSKRAYLLSSTTRSPSREIVGALIRIENPRARMSVAAGRGQLFSCLGELFWYLSGSDCVEQIAYYIPKYREESSDGKTVKSAYGPRLFRTHGLNQLEEVIFLLRQRPESRRAVIQLYDATDLREDKSPPCTCTLQFFVRDGQLHAFASMRSNDAFIGLPHDVFAFTMVQELIARELGVGLGIYSHAVGSLHLYLDNYDKAREYIEEGYQERVYMPPMPEGSPKQAVAELISYEKAVRSRGITSPAPESLDNYWLDIARLFAIYGSIKDKNLEALERLRGEMHSRVFDFAIQRKSRILRTKSVLNQGGLFEQSGE